MKWSGISRTARAGVVLLLGLVAFVVPAAADVTVPPHTISINDVTMNEGNTGTTSFEFTVTLTNPPSGMGPGAAVHVNYATANGTATGGAACTTGVDYITTSGSLTLNRNQLTRPITVQVCGETVFEPDETFFVDLNNADHDAVITKSRGTGTIRNDDVATVRPTSTNVNCTPATVPVLGSTTCTATVSDTDAGTSTPQGTVTFTLTPDDGESGAFTPAPTCTLDPTATGDSNSCSVTYTPTTVGDGTHEIGASYTPTDGVHAASSDPTPFQLSVRARFTSTNVTCDPATVPVLGSTTCTATVSDTDAGTSTPQGTVTFTLTPDDGESGAFTPAPTCTLDPTATGDSNSCSVTYTPTTVGDGTHEIGASYTPTDGVHAASSDPTPFQLSVRARFTSTNVTCDPATVPVLGSTTCTATVSDTDAGTSTPQGTVTFTLTPDDGESGAFTPAPTCTLDPTATGDSNSCSVTYTPTTVGDGTHEIGASYTPTDGVHAASSDPTPFQLTVRKRTTSTSVSCTPSTIEAGESTTCTATVSDTDAGTSTPQGTVTFSATGTGNSFVPPSCTLNLTATGDSNSCSVNYSSIQAAMHTVTASYGGSLTHEASTGTTTVTVEPGPPATLTLAPSPGHFAVNPVDTRHCETATVKDAFGNPTPGVTVRFSVTGANPTSGSDVTDAAGQAEFCYTGILAGGDVIRAFADTNSNGTRDLTTVPPEPEGEAAKAWTAPPSTPLCVVEFTTLGIQIIARNGDHGTGGGNVHVSEAGLASGSQEYQDHGPAEPMNVHATEILAVVCTTTANGKQSTIYFNANVDGAGPRPGRIEVEDNGEPGSTDTYWIIVSKLTGLYDSGKQVLKGGNVKIH